MQLLEGNPDKSGLCKTERWFKLSGAISDTRRVPLYKIALSCWICVFFAAMFALPVAAIDDDYVSAVSSEAEKVESERFPKAEPSTGVASGSSLEQDAGKNAFEEDLKTRYRGTHTFYMRLPMNHRDEVYQYYKEGASISEIRKLVMDRFLKR